MERKEYEMTQKDLDRLLNACKTVPMIALQCGAPRSPAQNANDAWQELGSRMGFDHMTVRSSMGGNRFFSAVPNAVNQRAAIDATMD